MLIFSRYSWWVASMIGLALMLAIMGQVGVLNPFQSVFLKVASPVERVLGTVFQPLASVLSNIGDLDQLEAENGRLRLENEELRNQVTSLMQDTERLKELEEAFNLTEGTSDTRVAADVVHRDSSPFTDVMTINRGSDRGIQVGMVVLSTQGSLLGTVTKVSGNQSFVRLITDTQSRVRSEILETGADGSLHGTPNRRLEFELAEGDIQVGDEVVTAGLGGNYPKGLPIGRVTEVSGTTQDLYKTVVVEPRVRISTVDTVLVLTSFIPEILELEDE